jgi:hypothetical protein
MALDPGAVIYRPAHMHANLLGFVSMMIFGSVQRYGIDACCGGALPVREAAQRHGAVAATVLAELQHAMAVTAEEEQPGACQLSPRPQSRV